MTSGKPTTYSFLLWSLVISSSFSSSLAELEKLSIASSNEGSRGNRVTSNEYNFRGNQHFLDHVEHELPTEPEANDGEGKHMLKPRVRQTKENKEKVGEDTLLFGPRHEVLTGPIQFSYAKEGSPKYSNVINHIREEDLDSVFQAKNDASMCKYKVDNTKEGKDDKNLKDSDNDRKNLRTLAYQKKKSNVAAARLAGSLPQEPNDMAPMRTTQGKDLSTASEPAPTPLSDRDMDVNYRRNALKDKHCIPKEISEGEICVSPEVLSMSSGETYYWAIADCKTVVNDESSLVNAENSGNTNAEIVNDNNIDPENSSSENTSANAGNANIRSSETTMDNPILTSTQTQTAFSSGGPTLLPTTQPSKSPTVQPTVSATERPTQSPTAQPTNPKKKPFWCFRIFC